MPSTVRDPFVVQAEQQAAVQATQPQQGAAPAPAPRSTVRDPFIVAEEQRQAELASHEASRPRGPTIPELITGSHRRTPETESLPEMQSLLGRGRGRLGVGEEPGALEDQTDMQQAMTFVGMITSVTPEQRRDVIRKQFPGGDVRLDEKKNEILTVNGEDVAVVNKPGFSRQDFTTLASNLVAFIRAGKLALTGAQAAKLGPVGQATAVAGGEAATSVGLDLTSMGAGSKQGVSLPRAALTGLVSGAVTLPGPLISSFRAWGLRNKLGKLVESDGTLTQKGQEELAKLGVQPGQFTPELQAKVLEVRGRLGPDAPFDTIVRQARGEAEDVSLLRSQATADLAGRQTIIQARHGPQSSATTSRANMQLDQFQKQQFGNVENRARRAALVDEQGRPVPGVIPAGSESEAAERSLQGVRARQAQEKEIAGGAQNAARAELARNSPQFEGRAIIDGIGRMSDARVGETTLQGLGDVITKESHPATTNMLANLAKVKERMGAASNARLRPVDFRTIDSFRVKLNEAIKGARSSDKTYLQSMRREYFEWLDDTMNARLYTGDKRGVEMLQSANAMWRRYITRWDDVTPPGAQRPDAHIKATMNRLIKDDVSGQEFVNMIFGRGQSLSGADKGGRVIEHVKRIVGTDSAEWAHLREAALRRIFAPAIEKKVGEFGVDAAIGELSKALDPKKGGRIMAALFSPKERLKLAQLRDALKDVQDPSVVTNPSKSGFTMLGALRAYARSFGAGGAIMTAGAGVSGEAPLAIALGIGTAASQAPRFTRWLNIWHEGQALSPSQFARQVPGEVVGAAATVERGRQDQAARSER